MIIGTATRMHKKYENHIYTVKLTVTHFHIEMKYYSAKKQGFKLYDRHLKPEFFLQFWKIIDIDYSMSKIVDSDKIILNPILRCMRNYKIENILELYYYTELRRIKDTRKEGFIPYV